MIVTKQINKNSIRNQKPNDNALIKLLQSDLVIDPLQTICNIAIDCLHSDQVIDLEIILYIK